MSNQFHYASSSPALREYLFRLMEERSIAREIDLTFIVPIAGFHAS